MEKVYFDPDFFGSWVVNDLSDMYSFKYVEGDEEKTGVLTWIKGEHVGLKEDDRIFGVVIDDEEFLFVLRYESSFGKFILNSKNPLDLDRLLRNRKIFFVGEKINLVG